MNAYFPNLFSPIRVGNLTLRNRIVNTGHGTGFTRDHVMTDQHIYYHAGRARGGVAMIITEAIHVHPTSNTGSVETVWGFDERNLPWYKRVSETVHENGAFILGQLLHMGRQSGGGQRRLRWAPSPIAAEELPYGAPEVPHEMNEDEIHETVESYAACARLVREGGMDGVEIHAGGGNLIPQFLSPLTNRRTDQYGGDKEGRLRFAMEVLEAVRGAVGKECVVGMRISGDEFTEGGLSVDDMKEICHSLSATGKLDYMNIIVGVSTDIASMSKSIPSMYIPPASFADVWEEIKGSVGVPVMGVGRINSPEVAERVLAEGKADLVGMVRELLADPQLPNKAREGRAVDIRPCVACMQGCLGRRLTGSYITCIHHPETGRERDWIKMTPAAHKKRVIVVGGGPAGLEAARGAARRGHEVYLYEQNHYLGGQVRTAAKAPKRDAFGQIVTYSETRMRKSGVDVRLGQEATAETILALRPDAVVLATGSVPVVPRSERNGITLTDVESVLEEKVGLGENVLVVDTLGLHPGSDVAEFLALRGKKVTVATTCTHVGANIEHLTWRLLYQRLVEHGVVMMPFTGYREVRNGAVVACNTITRQDFLIEGIDAVVFAIGRRANDNLYHLLKPEVRDLHLVGDSLAPRGVEEAVFEAKRLGRVL